MFLRRTLVINNWKNFKTIWRKWLIQWNLGSLYWCMHISGIIILWTRVICSKCIPSLDFIIHRWRKPLAQPCWLWKKICYTRRNLLNKWLQNEIQKPKINTILFGYYNKYIGSSSETWLYEEKNHGTLIG